MRGDEDERDSKRPDPRLQQQCGRLSARPSDDVEGAIDVRGERAKMCMKERERGGRSETQQQQQQGRATPRVAQRVACLLDPAKPAPNIANFRPHLRLLDIKLDGGRKQETQGAHGF